MNPATEKKLQAAMDRIFYTQAEAANFRKRGLKAVKLWKGQLKQEPSNDNVKKIVKDVVPTITKLHKLTSKIEKELEKLHDAGTDEALIADYYDGREFRERNKKLLKTADEFDRKAAPIVTYLKTMAGGLFPLMNLPDVKVTVDSLAGFTKEWNSLKIALNRI